MMYSFPQGKRVKIWISADYFTNYYEQLQHNLHNRKVFHQLLYFNPLNSALRSLAVSCRKIAETIVTC